MTPDFIGNLTVVTIILVVLLTVIGASVSIDWIWRNSQMALVGKAYRKTFVLIGVGFFVIAIAVWIL